jgi:hypothetical protein
MSKMVYSHVPFGAKTKKYDFEVFAHTHREVEDDGYSARSFLI